MAEIDDALMINRINEALFQAPFLKAQKEYHEQATKYYQAQIELVADQKRYSKTITRATIFMATATVVYAVISILQYLLPIK